MYSFPNNCFVTRWSLSRMGIIALVRYSATRVLHCDVRLLICFCVAHYLGESMLVRKLFSFTLRAPPPYAVTLL